MIVDFTSSLYLGLRHARSSLEDWPQLTTGAPAALGEPPVARHVAGEVARLVGCESALVATSTLHLAWDLGVLVEQLGAVLFVDHSAYPILRVAADVARGRGATVRRFRGHDADALRDGIQELGDGGRPVVVIADGFCPMCRRVPPIAEYARVVSKTGGFVVMDDTQALGILGRGPTTARPYGRGGAGTLAWTGQSTASVLLVASHAKGFGAPLATLAGSQALVSRFTAASMTRSHCSPPSLAALNAAARALSLNQRYGDRLRSRLAAAVRSFRGRMTAAGVRLEPGLFPVQAVRAPRGSAAAELQRELARAGVNTVLTDASGSRGRRRARLVFVLTADHTAQDIERAATVTASALVQDPLFPVAEVPCKSGNQAPSRTLATFHSSTSEK